ncbi:MAG TPA: N-acetyltransferase [Croceibacterium sp.]|nr:N-acetyltransferase [Croceibacterium sp.]
MADLALPTLIPLDQADPAAVERLLDTAFGPGRHQRTAYAIRHGTACLPPLCFAAYDEQGALVGTIQAFPVALTDAQGRAHPLVMIGPVAIDPERQGQGFGRALMAAQRAALEEVRGQGGAALPQVLIGDAPYYARFGFVEAPRGWQCPGPWDPERLLVRAENPAVLPRAGMLGPWT